MSQQSDSPTKSMTSGETLATLRRVKISGSTVIYADATDYGIGVNQAVVGTSGDEATIRLDCAGSLKMTALNAISAGATVYAAADGKIAASGTIILGTALEASTANNDVIEVLPSWVDAEVDTITSDLVLVSDALVGDISDMVLVSDALVGDISDMVLDSDALVAQTSDAKAAVAAGIVACTAGDSANASDVYWTLSEVLTAISDALG